MTIVLTYILRPVIGAVIGYITNDIAIRMLFRPRTAKYIFGIKVPFTPGIIPKEKTRIAASIGNAISKNLMNREVLEKTLLSPDMTSKITGGIDEFVARQSRNSQTVVQFLEQYLSHAEIEAMRTSISTDLSTQIHSALSSAGLGEKIAAIAVSHVMDKMKVGLPGVLGKFGPNKILELIAGPVESLLAKNINEMLANHSEEMVTTLISGQISSFMELPMKKLFIGKEEKIEQAKTTIISLYRTLVTEQLPKILDTINISGMIENRINEMDVKESEKLILEVMNKELKAIVWLGALLGFLMGCINLLF